MFRRSEYRFADKNMRQTQRRLWYIHTRDHAVMASSYIAAACARRNIHYGWVVMGVTFVILLVTAAAMSTPGGMIVRLERRPDLLGAGAAHPAVRAVRSVRGRADEPVRRAPRDLLRAGADRRRH